MPSIKPFDITLSDINFLLKADFAHYVKPLTAGDTEASYGSKTFNVDTDPDSDGLQYAPLTNYTTTVDNVGTVTQSNVVDYTPQMISRTVTTAGAAVWHP